VKKYGLICMPDSLSVKLPGYKSQGRLELLFLPKEKRFLKPHRDKVALWNRK